MRRLRDVKAYLVDEGGFNSADIVCHITEDETIPVEQKTETGIHLFDNKYDAVIFIEDVSEKEYGYIKLLLYDWFRANRLSDEESYRLSSDEITDKASLVTISLTLIEQTHISPDEEGVIERDEDMYQENENPIASHTVL